MRVLCLNIESFAAAVEKGARPELAHAPLIIGGQPHERRPVYETSPEAARYGVRPGMPLREAHHLCPDAVFLPLDEGRYSRAFEEVLAVLDRYSPSVEFDRAGKAFMDADGLDRTFGREDIALQKIFEAVSRETGFCPSIGLANSKFVADVAAGLCHQGEVNIVPAGTEQEFLGLVAIEVLPVSGEVKRRLKLVGVRTIGQLSRFTGEALVSQFGQEGFLVQQFAAGLDDRPIVSRPRQAALEASICFEDAPLEGLEDVMRALRALLGKLLPALVRSGQVCSKLLIKFYFDSGGPWQGWLTLKFPTRSRAEMVGRIGRKLAELHFVKPAVYEKHRFVARTQPLLLIEGIVQKEDGIVNLIARRLAPLHETEPDPLPAPGSRNFT